MTVTLHSPLLPGLLTQPPCKVFESFVPPRTSNQTTQTHLDLKFRLPREARADRFSQTVLSRMVQLPRHSCIAHRCVPQSRTGSPLASKDLLGILYWVVDLEWDCNWSSSVTREDAKAGRVGEESLEPWLAGLPGYFFGIKQGSFPGSSPAEQAGSPGLAQVPGAASSPELPLPSADSSGYGALTAKRCFLFRGKQGMCRALEDPPSDRDFWGLLLDFFKVLSHCRNLVATHQSIN